MKSLKKLFSVHIVCKMGVVVVAVTLLNFQVNADIPAIISGQVIKVGAKTVILSQRGGKVKVEVPRSSISKHFDLKVGNIVQAELDGAGVVKQMKENAKAAKKRNTEMKKAIKEAQKKGEHGKIKAIKEKAKKPAVVKFK